MIELHDKLRSYGVSEAEIQALPRWWVTRVRRAVHGRYGRLTRPLRRDAMLHRRCAQGPREPPA